MRPSIPDVSVLYDWLGYGVGEKEDGSPLTWVNSQSTIIGCDEDAALLHYLNKHYQDFKKKKELRDDFGEVLDALKNVIKKRDELHAALVAFWQADEPQKAESKQWMEKKLQETVDSVYAFNFAADKLPDIRFKFSEIVSKILSTILSKIQDLCKSKHSSEKQPKDAPRFFSTETDQKTKELDKVRREIEGCVDQVNSYLQKDESRDKDINGAFRR